MKNVLSILFSLCLLFGVSCENSTGEEGISSEGIIKVSEVTSYQYGSHILVDENGITLFAIKNSDKVLNYIGKKVTVRGHLIRGYAVDGGPEYLMISEIE